MKRFTLITTAVLLGIGRPAFAEIEKLTIDRGTFSERDGIASLSGTVTCTPGHTFMLTKASVTQTQDSKRATASGSSPAELTCTGSSQPWSVVLSAPASLRTPPLKAGPVSCHVTASDITDQTFVNREEPVDLQSVD